MAKPINERLAELQAQKAKLTARMARLESKAKSAERKRDTRRKIIVGAAVLAHVEHDRTFAYLLRTALQKAVIREADREVIADLLAPPALPQAAQPAAANANATGRG